MIEIAPETASMLYVGLLLFILFGFWGYDNWKDSKKNLSLTDNEEKINCEFCGHTFRNISILPIIRCPICQCLISKDRKPN